MRKTKNKKRGGKPFSIFERSKIETRWRIDFKSMSEIAREIGRNKSSVSREIQGKPRKGRGGYQAHTIEDRPKAVEKRNRLGDWEDDTIVSKQSLVRLKNVTERKSGNKQ